MFTDVEGSTRLLGQNPDAYRVAVRRHHDLLEQAVVAHGGVVFETVGDAVYAAFSEPGAAVAAALAGQLTLQRESWGAMGALPVRMGVHTGVVERQGRRYFGVPLYRCARLMATAHGGQVVVSAVTAALVQDALPEGASLRDLGEHRLKDLSRPERISQLVHAALAQEFPPLRSLDALPHNLPPQLNDLIGREADVAAVLRLQAEHRLVTLTGPGGTGKTRLSLQVVAEALEGYPDGAWFVELAPLSEAAHVARAAAAVLGVREEPDVELTDSLTTALAHKRLLLLLDNCEHVLSATAQLADRLLRGCPGLRTLATSRAPLRLYGEQEYLVPPLALPDLTLLAGARPAGARPGEAAPPGAAGLPGALPPGAGLQAAGPPGTGAHSVAAAITRVPTVALFVQRARAVNPAFTLAAEDVAHVAQICHRLDGLPLAIELAAARTRLFSPQALLARLLGTYGQTPLRLLTGGAGNAPSRQQTLRGAIEWSHDLLSPDEQRLFRHLAVFAGGCAFESAEAIVADLDIDLDVIAVLESLVEKNLVRRSESAGGEARFSLLEMIREFGLEQLAAHGETAAARAAHARCFARLAEDAAPALRSGAAQAWLEALRREHANVREALRYFAEHGGRHGTAQGLRLAAALWKYWELRGHATEGRDWLRRLLDQPHAAPLETATSRETAASPLSARLRGTTTPPTAAAPLQIEVQTEPETDVETEDWQRTRLRALLAAGSLAHDQDDYPAARACFDEALQLSETLGDVAGTAQAIHGLGDVLRYSDDLAGALTHYERALVLWHQTGDRYDIAQGLYSVGTAIAHYGDDPHGHAVLRESLAIRREIGDRHGEAWCLHILSLEAWKKRDEYPEGFAVNETRRAFSESLAAREALGDRHGMAYSLARLGEVALYEGDLVAARVHLTRSVALGRAVGDNYLVLLTLETHGSLLGAEGRPRAALRLISATRHLRQTIGSGIAVWEQERRAVALARIRAAVPEPDASAAWTAGEAMTLDEGIDFAAQEGRPAEGRPAESLPAAGEPAGAPTHPSAPGAAPGAGSGLTRREREVATLIAAGLTNKQIAERLVISERTADTHVQNILGKLGFATRAQVASWTARQEGTPPHPDAW